LQPARSFGYIDDQEVKTMAKKKKPTKPRPQPSATRTTRKKKPKKVEPLLDERPGFESKTWQQLAAEQGVGPFDFDAWMAEVKKHPVWPEDESVDDFVATYRAWRHGEDPPCPMP
jgi:hypothetical protein